MSIRALPKFLLILVLGLLPGTLHAQDVLIGTYPEQTVFDQPTQYYDSGGRFLGEFGDFDDEFPDYSLREHPITGNIFKGTLVTSGGLGAPGGPSNFVIEEYDGTSGKFIRAVQLGGSSPILFLPTNFQLNAVNGNIIVLADDTNILIGFSGGAPVFAKKLAEYDWQTGVFVREYRDPLGAGFEITQMARFHPQNNELYIFNRAHQMLHFSPTTGAFLGVKFQTSSAIIGNSPNATWHIHPNTGNVWVVFCTEIQAGSSPLTDDSFCEIDSNSGLTIRAIPRRSENGGGFSPFSESWTFNPVTGDLVYAMGSGVFPAREKFISRVWVVDTATGLIKGELGETRNFTWKVQNILFLTNNKARPNMFVQPESNERRRSAWKRASGTAKPEVITYRLINRSNTAINYAITQSVDWMDVDEPTGTLQPRERKLVHFTFNNNQINLGLGSHKNTITFTDQTQNVSMNRSVTLYVGKDTFDKLNLSTTSLDLGCVDQECNLLGTLIPPRYDVNTVDGSTVGTRDAFSENWFIRGGSSNVSPTPSTENFRTTIRWEAIDWETQHNPGYLIIYDDDTEELLGVVEVTLNLPPQVQANSTTDNASQVLSPFWQAGTGTYSFVSISHPSLQGMSSQIGVRAIPIMDNGFSSPEFLVQEFTISAGETKAYFLVPPGNSNPAFFLQNQNTNTVARLPGEATGSLRFEPIASDPKVQDIEGNYPDITMLTYWGAVVFESGNTGFALEFIGDLADSSSHPNQQPSRFATGVN